MSYVKPADLVGRMIDAGAGKLLLSTRDTLIRGFMGGALLTLGAAFAVTVTVQTGQPLLGALLFPIGFILLYLLGYDLLTGVFTLAPLALLARRPGASVRSILRNWGLVFVGNFAGAFTVALVMAICFTYAFSTAPNEVGLAIREIGHGRTVGYAEHGAGGMLTLFLRGVLCNVMVSTGVIAAMMSDALISKVIAMWMPVMLFFSMGFEHSVVNMFLFPSGLLLGADFTIGDYLVWNEIPTVLGNLVGGVVFVGLVLYATHHRTAPARVPAVSPAASPAAAPAPTSAQPVAVVR
ncbi:MAG: formate/nitrite transporter family protein [Brachybacterium tyrofermentans]|uniref:Formate/nitrite transporter family protein n=1 Tax=Brachybacterium tyrofermentans TaxID=47848 RepID=A0ABW0FKX4_9MICO|nr:formate/nitrite transporter family protein [Brachybacterium tyrofermentans]SLN01271.1 Nitrite transporter from formate/nitrite family [Corynebacterium xerosis]